MAAIPDVDATLVVAKNFISEFLPDINVGMFGKSRYYAGGQADGLPFCDMKGEHYD